MIFEINTGDIEMPYACQGESLYMSKGLINPRLFSEKFLKTPWLPFENFVFELGSIETLLRVAGEPFYRQQLSNRMDTSPCFEITRPNKMDDKTVSEWLDYSSNII
jgi:hypothetical protein